jgi:hypothetical protein
VPPGRRRRRLRIEGTYSAPEQDLAGVEPAIDAVGDDGLARFEREFGAVDVDVDPVRFEADQVSGRGRDRATPRGRTAQAAAMRKRAGSNRRVIEYLLGPDPGAGAA